MNQAFDIVYKELMSNDVLVVQAEDMVNNVTPGGPAELVHFRVSPDNPILL